MKRLILSWIGIMLAGTGYLEAARLQSSNPAPAPSSEYRTTLNRYCVTCHNEKLKTAGLLLDKMDVANVPPGAEIWEKVIRKLRTSAMPPPGMPRPDKAFYDSFATYLETEIDRAAAAKPNPGSVGMHRLNRAEYVNAVRDLVAIDLSQISGDAVLPADDAGYGFDNIADNLSVSPALLERYMSVAQRVRRLALGDPTIKPEFKKYSIPKLLMQEDRMSEDLPFGSRGGIAIQHRFPLDGEYVVKILLRRDPADYIEGLSEPHQLDVRLDGVKIKQFTVGGVHKGRSETTFTTYGDPEQVDYERHADKDLEIRFSAKAGTRVVAVAFLNDITEPEGAYRPHQTGLGTASLYKDHNEGDPELDSISISGPYEAKGSGDTPSRRRIFVCYPASSAGATNTQRVSFQLNKNINDEDACARKILATLARRAYRRTATEAEIQTLYNFYKADRGKDGFEAGIGTALRRILVSPQFLFRTEVDPGSAPNTPHRLTDIELASRLSFFIWSSIPDDELLDVAERGKLKDPAVLLQQVRRMLTDPRSKALIENFGGQWLYLRNVKAAQPDQEIFPYFDENLREAFQKETELFFDAMLREDHSVMDLLNANFTFVNDRLAQHYGIPNVYGSHFRRVTLTDENRRGLLGQASILMVTSYSTRTSPTLRGKWLLENVLGAPPPPPPPNVPSLEDRGADGKILSVRQAMEKHRSNPVCATCHGRMDPLGFAMDNFDAIGQWRDLEAGKPIDSSGVLPDGTKFQGSGELRKLLSSHPEQFATTITEKLLTYALGRGVEYYDEPAVRKIVREAGTSDYRWSSIIAGIAKSTPFQMRRSKEEQ